MFGGGKMPPERQPSLGRKEGSFVLNKDAGLLPQVPESPKLWRTGGGSKSPRRERSKSPTKSPARSKEDLFSYYETLGHEPAGTTYRAPVDLSMKDLVERTASHQRSRTKPSSIKEAAAAAPAPKPKTGREAGAKSKDNTLRNLLGNFKDHKGGDHKGGDQKGGGAPVSPKSPRSPRTANPFQHQNLQSVKTKVYVPPKANGDQLYERNGPRTPESLYRSRSAHEPSSWDHDTSYRGQKRVSPTGNVTANSPRAHHPSLYKPSASTSNHHHDQSHQYNSQEQYSQQHHHQEHHQQHRRHHHQQQPPRSPTRSPMASPLNSPRGRRASPLASASSPARLGGPQMPMDWVMPGDHSGYKSPSFWEASAASPLHHTLAHTQSPRMSTEEAYYYTPEKKRTPPPTYHPPPTYQEHHPNNHCSTCRSYTINKTRCLVCGNIYCKKCVKDAMGDMPEGRKCRKTCVGKPFHNKYEDDIGKGCWFFGLPRATKIAEHRWVRRSAYNASSKSSYMYSQDRRQSVPHRPSVSSMPPRLSTSSHVPPRLSTSSNMPPRLSTSSDVPPRLSTTSNLPPRLSISSTAY